jgi:hypothetical protein
MSLLDDQIALAKKVTSTITVVHDGEIERARQLLRAKRRAEVEHLIPQLANALATSFRSLFNHYAQTARPTTTPFVRQDALGFTAWIRRHRELSPQLRDLAHYEYCRLQSLARGPLWISCRLQHDPFVSGKSAHYLFIRWHKNDRLKRYRLSLPG